MEEFGELQFNEEGEIVNLDQIKEAMRELLKKNLEAVKQAEKVFKESE